jgi:hypothetical protein
VAEAHPSPAGLDALRIGGDDPAAQGVHVDCAPHAGLELGEREQDVRSFDRPVCELARVTARAGHDRLRLLGEATEEPPAVAPAGSFATVVVAVSVGATAASRGTVRSGLVVARAHDLVDALMTEEQRLGDLPHVAAASVEQADRVVVVRAQVLELALCGKELLADLLRLGEDFFVQCHVLFPFLSMTVDKLAHSVLFV